MLKYISIFILLLTLISCSKTPEDEFEDALLEANFLLSEDKCAEARAKLLAVGSSATTNSLYLQILASTYACDAGYSDLDFFSEASTKLATGSTDFLNSLSKFNFSVDETSAETTDFQSMISAIEVLSSGGGNTAADHDGREAIFGESGTQAMNLQSLFMTAATIGRYVSFYADTDGTTGIKTRCLYTYARAISRAAVDAGPATACSNGSGYAGGNSGTTADAIRRACQGIVLYNQLIDLFLNTSLTNSDDYGDLDLVYANISTAYDTYCAQNANTQATCDLKTVEQCTDYYDADNNRIDYIELYLAAIMETTLL